MMNDDRNDTEYKCVTVSSTVSNATFTDIVDESYPTILYVAGEYQYTAIPYSQRVNINSLKFDKPAIVVVAKLWFVWVITCISHTATVFMYYNLRLVKEAGKPPSKNRHNGTCKLCRINYGRAPL